MGERVNSCNECGSSLSDFSYLLLYGSWNSNKNKFSRAPQKRAICRSCWNEIYKRIPGAYYEVEDVNVLWNILSASNGKLVADLKHNFVGGRPLVRVSDDEIECISIVHEKDENGRVVTTTETADVDREWLEDIVENGDKPTIAILRPVQETKFK